MKQWTDIPLHQNEAAKPQTFNNNIETTSRSIQFKPMILLTQHRRQVLLVP